MILLLFAVLAPLFSFQWRRLAALCVGVIAEIFSPIPFGVTLGLFLSIVFFIELLEQRVATRKTGGWAVAALGAIGLVVLGEAVFVIVFDRVSLSLAAALLISELIIGVLIIGFLWIPIKLNIAHDKQR